MASVRYSDLVLEMADLCREIKDDLTQRLRYYRASVYKHEAVRQINERVDQLRAIFQILADEDLSDAMADHDAVFDSGPQMLAAGECTVTARVNILIAGMDPALNALTRRFSKSQSVVRDETMKALHRHRNTLMSVCREGSRSWEILRGM